MRARRPGPVALVLLAISMAMVTLSACSGGTDSGQPDPEAVLATAKKKLDATSGVRIGLSTQKLPAGVQGLLGATGVGTHAPAFDGTIKVSVGGVVADAAVVSVGGTTHAKLPFTSKFVVIDPDDYGAPDPADLLSRHGGLSSLLTAATRVARDTQVRDGDQVLTRYTAHVPGRAVSAVIPSADPSASFPATFTVDDQGRLSTAVLTGPFYPRSKDVTYTITFRDYGLHRTIRAPG